MIQSLDLVVLIGIHQVAHTGWTQVTLAKSLYLSQPTLHRSLKRLLHARLLIGEEPRIVFRPLLNILDVARYIYPAVVGDLVRGIPTAQETPYLAQHLTPATPYVWPDKNGPVIGYALEPLHPSILPISKDFPSFYETMCLIDTLRVGGVREILLARERLHHLLSGPC